MSEIEKQNNLLNDDIQIYQEPFMHWEMKDMFDKLFYEELKKDFPKVEDFNLDDEVMGGRFQINTEDAKFWEIIENSKSWRRFWNYFNSQGFVFSIFESFKETIESIGTNLDIPNLKFDKNHKYNLFNDIEDKTDKSLNDIFIDFDFSIAKNGYKREVHTDLNDRIFSFMLYFSNVTGDGGTLELYDIARETIPYIGDNGQVGLWDRGSYCRGCWDNNNIKLNKTIQPKENLGIWKLDYENSWHAVPEMKNNDGWRKFVYVAVTSKQVGVWKNKVNSIDGVVPNVEQHRMREKLKF